MPVDGCWHLSTGFVTGFVPPQPARAALLNQRGRPSSTTGARVPTSAEGYVQAFASRSTISVSRSRRGGDVEPDVPGGARVVGVARADLDPTALERDGGGVVVAVGAQVEPGEVGRLQRAHPGLGEVVGEQLAEQRALLVEPLDERGQPRVAVVVRRTRGHDAERRPRVVARHRRVEQPVAGRPSSGTTTWAHRRPAVLNAFDAATTATAWSAVPVDREVGDVLGAGQHQRRVDLVADHPGAVRGRRRRGCPRARRG